MMSSLGTRLGRRIAIILVTIGLAVGIAGLSVAFSTDTPAPPAETAQPGKVEQVGDVARITLTEDGAARLGLRTAPVREAQAAGGRQLLVPYAAILYDPAGVAWAYTSTAPLTYMRHKVTVISVQGDTATLSDGPVVGTAVVTVGVSELYGTEVGVGEE